MPAMPTSATAHNAREEILEVIEASGGWKVFLTADNLILSAQWRRRIVTIKFRTDGQVEKLFLRYPLPFNQGVQLEEYKGTGKREVALRFIRGEKQPRL